MKAGATPGRRLKSILAALAVAALGLAGCTKASSPTVAPPVSESVVPTSTPASQASVPVSSVSTAVTASASAPSSTASTAPATSTTATKSTVRPAGCPSSALKIDVQRGSGVAGHQYATLSFTNTSATACPLAGSPTVQLLAGGAPIGSALSSGATATTVSLAPGATAVSALVNDSTCGAPTSDSIQVTAPNTTAKVVLPLEFRGCTVTVGPITAS